MHELDGTPTFVGYPDQGLCDHVDFSVVHLVDLVGGHEWIDNENVNAEISDLRAQSFNEPVVEMNLISVLLCENHLLFASRVDK
jgi:hypothetical protein